MSGAEQGLERAELRAVQAAAAGEREVLESFLDYLREAVLAKATGLSDADARRALVPSDTTLAGMLVHLEIVERRWFQMTLHGRTREEFGLDFSKGDTTWEVPPEATLDSLADAYRAACADSRASAAEFGLDHTVPEAELGRVSLRWIMVHMIEETGRHAGHADILREQTDGRTGQR
ncbi:uncharacterized protein DUF664 [Murinocardiopsis flavida]|uniref:Uncharacterized protein DUF664 n=1 Tax=Murinocardiopsis flavida TaxID=645275 RepID=A0A2P8CMS5_9ACTN|nr:DinB family protein [Murinocardiopsis flavida]PSK86261.1 uncharacterized protein DUF664 [Murinocardiopsis flavida]